MIIYFCRARNRNRTMKKILDFKTVCECNRNLGCKTWHPQVSIINLENLNLKQEAVKFDFYTILLIEECPNSCCCGRKYYDFSNTTMVFLMPGEIFRMSEHTSRQRVSISLSSQSTISDFIEKPYPKLYLFPIPERRSTPSLPTRNIKDNLLPRKYRGRVTSSNRHTQQHHPLKTH